MTIRFEFLPTVVFVIVMLCWVVFAGAFLLRKKPTQTPERKRDRASEVGLVLQGVAYAIIWWKPRDLFTPIGRLGIPVEIALAVITVALGAGAVWITLAAVRTLGKHWSITARLVEGHKLVAEGPYRLVRHPIYTGMLGMLLATGLAVSHWNRLLPAVVVFGIGTAIRVRSEEKLLREAFGQEFEAYARRVGAIFPRLRY